MKPSPPLIANGKQILCWQCKKPVTQYIFPRTKKANQSNTCEECYFNIECDNCEKVFRQFRFKEPFSNTCKTCIRKAWHISEKDKSNYLGEIRTGSLEKFL